MGKRSWRVSVRLGATLLVALLAGLASPPTAEASGYLRVVGPTPLRFETRPALDASTPKAVESTVAPLSPPLELTSATSPTPTISPPDILKSLLAASLWVTFCDGFFGDSPATNWIRPNGNNVTPPTKTPEVPTVTAEMLADFFKMAEPVTNIDTNAAAASLSGSTSPVFVLPSSQAIYNSP